MIRLFHSTIVIFDFPQQLKKTNNMPNNVTNRLEINADNGKIQEIMNFLKGEPDEVGTPCYIDFNKIIPMPKELKIEASSSGDNGSQYILAMERKPYQMDRKLAGGKTETGNTAR